MKINLRVLYLYLFSFVGLLIVVIGGTRLIDLGLKTFILKDADRYEVFIPSALDEKAVNVEEQMLRHEKDLSRQRQRELSGAISMIAVGIPLYLYHWKTIQKEGN